MNVADVVVEELMARDVSWVATLNGHGLAPFLNACRHANMRIIDVRNEQSAGYMAEVAGRLTRSVGVCAVSGAVAHANALTGVLNAHFDGAPMLLITGIAPQAALGWGNFQDFNPVPMAAPICKYARMIDVPKRAAQIVHDAFTAATSGRPGPVHLTLPMDVAETAVQASDVPRSHVRSGQVRMSGDGDPALIEEAVHWLRDAKQPLLIAGSGVYYSQGEQGLSQFVCRQKIPVCVPIWDRGSVVDPIEPFMGVIGAASGGPRLLEDADLVIVAGAAFDYRIGQISPPNLREDAQVIRIDADSSQLRAGIEAHLSIQGSPANVLGQLARACAAANVPPAEAWLQEACRRRDEHRQRCHDAAPQGSRAMSGRDVALAVQRALTDDTILLVDGGNIGQWFHQMLTDRYPGHWVTCGASGVVGWGLPGAMAARAHDPDRPVILLSGDGAFTFTIAELECAARQRLPFVAVVADDEEWGISVTGHRKQYGDDLYSLLGPTRLDQVAEGFGCRGVRVDSIDQLDAALNEALQHVDVPTIIQVPIIPGSPGD